MVERREGCLLANRNETINIMSREKKNLTWRGLEPTSTVLHLRTNRSTDSATLALEARVLSLHVNAWLRAIFRTPPDRKDVGHVPNSHFPRGVASVPLSIKKGPKWLPSGREVEGMLYV